jgi:holo-[acyl-carrier protein] synthase
MPRREPTPSTAGASGRRNARRQAATPIQRVGTDIVAIERLARSLRRQPAFAETVFSREERSYCDAQARPDQHYAARFAAKEAFLKAVGRGVLDGVVLREVEVVRDADGGPSFRLGPTAAAALADAGGRDALVSLSHDGGMALAFVVVR